MSFTVNEVTHEVTLVMDGHEVKLRASFERMAEFQRRADVGGYATAMMLLHRLDARAVFAGLVALSGSQDGSEFDNICGPKHLSTAALAVSAALTEAMPEAVPGKTEAPDH